MNLVGQLLDNSDVFLETLDFYVLFEHFDEALEDELLQEFVVDFGVRDFSCQGRLDVLLDSLNILMPELHFRHSGFVDFSTFHDLDFGFEIFLFFMEVVFIFIFGIEEDFASFELLLIAGFLLNKVNFLLLVLFDSLSEFGHSAVKDIFPVDVHEMQIKISILLNFYTCQNKLNRQQKIKWSAYQSSFKS